MSRNQRDRAHWAKRYRELADWELMLPQCHQPQQDGEVRHVAVVFCKRSGPASDEDNLYGRLKVILDSLQKRKWIKDDSPRWITIEVSEERGRTGTVVTVFGDESKAGSA